MLCAQTTAGNTKSLSYCCGYVLLDEGSSADATSPSPSLQSQRDPLCAGCLTWHKDAAPHQAQKTYQHNFNFHPQLSPPVLGHLRKMKQLALMYAARGQKQIISILEPGQKKIIRKQNYQVIVNGSQELKIPCTCCEALLSRGQLPNRLLGSCIVIAFFSIHLLFVSIYKNIAVRQHSNEEAAVICDDLVEEFLKNKN